IFSATRTMPWTRKPEPSCLPSEPYRSWRPPTLWFERRPRSSFAPTQAVECRRKSWSVRSIRFLRQSRRAAARDSAFRYATALSEAMGGMFQWTASWDGGRSSLSFFLRQGKEEAEAVRILFVDDHQLVR